MKLALEMIASAVISAVVSIAIMAMGLVVGVKMVGWWRKWRTGT